MPDGKARVVLATAIAAYGSEDLLARMEELGEEWYRHLVVVEEKMTGLEVVRVERMSEEATSIYESEAVKRKVRSVGKMRCKRWTFDDFQTWDRPNTGAEGAEQSQDVEYEFMVEEHILENVFVAMKMEGTIRRLALRREGEEKREAPSFWHIDSLSRTYCSFFTYLANELATKPFKEVQWKTEEELKEKEEKEDAEENGW